MLGEHQRAPRGQNFRIAILQIKRLGAPIFFPLIEAAVHQYHSAIPIGFSDILHELNKESPESSIPHLRQYKDISKLQNVRCKWLGIAKPANSILIEDFPRGKSSKIGPCVWIDFSAFFVAKSLIYNVEIRCFKTLQLWQLLPSRAYRARFGFFRHFRHIPTSVFCSRSRNAFPAKAHTS